MAQAAPASRAPAFKTEAAEGSADTDPRPGAQRPQRLSVLGATGSIGASTLDLVGRHP